MESFTLIIFGITSNLAQIKLIPALYDMEEEGVLPKGMSIIGIARKPRLSEDFKRELVDVLKSQNRHHQHIVKTNIINKLAKRFYYLDGQLEDPNLYPKLNNFVNKLTNDKSNRIFYLATYPNLYHTVFNNLKQAKMNEETFGFVRLMIEKPIGTDYKSAIELNKLLAKFFKEEQIYRLDHYLGKETLQNILTFRFGNGLFEPLINKDFVDHIQITAAEDFGIGKRGGYYDLVGALKDVGQNHLLQMLVFATMDAPAEFSNEAVTKERVKILDNLITNPKKVVFGQYQNYIREENVNPKSNKDTYFAFKTEVNNQRFKGVPIYIRGGKKLSQTVTEIVIIFKNPINRLFKHLEKGLEPNILIYRIQPNEGIVLEILTKKPGPKVELNPEVMQFCYRPTKASHYLPDPYERLLLDAIKGDQTFFNDAKEVESAWKFIDPLAKNRSKLHIYKEGTWGPKAADDLIKADGRSWIEPSMDFCKI